MFVMAFSAACQRARGQFRIFDDEQPQAESVKHERQAYGPENLEVEIIVVKYSFSPVLRGARGCPCKFIWRCCCESVAIMKQPRSGPQALRVRGQVSGATPVNRCATEVCDRRIGVIA